MSEKPSEAFECRTAKGADAATILTVLQEVAPEVPVSLDAPKQQDAMRHIISECCASGESWVATDAKGGVVGFVLAKPDILERFHHENNALSLRYLGVSKAWRRRGVFAALMAKLTAKREPLTASVLPNNQSAMADRLAKIGFVKTESTDKVTKLRWNPKG